MLSRQSVLRMVAAVAAAIVVSSGAALLWLVFIEKVWGNVWPARPRMHGFEPFAIFGWIALLAPLCGVTCGVAALVAARHGGERTAGVVPAILICVLSAAAYWPFSGMTTQRLDRLRGSIEEPLVAARALGMTVVATFALCAVFVLVTSMRRTPLLTRQVCRAVMSVLGGMLLNLYVLFMVLPMTNGWDPAQWQRPDLHIPFRPCRGAVVWIGTSTGKIIRYGRVDDVWSRFADPRASGSQAEAVSIESDWRREYVWLRLDELPEARVRRDDPAVVDCDDRVRTEPVAPAEWHQVGLRW